MGKMQRTKGATEERRIASLYEWAMGKEVKRELDQYQEKLGRDLRGCQPYCVQIKVGKRPGYRKAFEEALSAVRDGYGYPIAHVREDNKQAIVMLPETLWIVIVEMLKEKLK
jgi:hypothetical protein